jgi:CHAT domain-containing protein
MDERHQSQPTFFDVVLSAIAEHNSSAVVYDLIKQHIDRLDDKSSQSLQEWSIKNMENSDNTGKVEEIAKSIGNFCVLISDFPLGNRATNLDLAIAGYEIIAPVFIREQYPEFWASLQINIGNAYNERINGEKFENLERAIDYYQQALLELTQNSYPALWAATQNNLGVAYKNRIVGAKAVNLEQALKCYQYALIEYDKDIYTERFADVINNIGTTYLYRIFGNRADNLEEAVRFYQQSLQVYESESDLPNWAMANHNLGNAYNERILGNKSDNLDRAIDCYQQALMVRTRQRFPEKWADIQHDLATAYLKKQDIEEAIKRYKQSLSVRNIESFPDKWAMSQHALGSAYCTRVQGNKESNLERGIDCYEQALLVNTREDFPEKWAMIKNSLGSAYIHLSNLQEKSDVKKICALAIKYLTESLQIRTYESFPQSYAVTTFNLGIAYHQGQQQQLAYNNLRLAIDTVEALRSEILVGDEAKQKLAEEWNTSYQLIVQVCLELGNYTDAIEYVERSKTRNLVELLLARDRHTIFPAKVVTQLDRLRDKIASGQYELQNATAEDPTALAQHLQQLRQQRNELQDRYLPIGSGFQFEQFRSSLSDRTAIVEFYLTTDKLLVFIITNQTQPPIILSPDLINQNKLAKWASSYLNAYRNKKSHWQRRLTTRLNLLAKILRIDEIIQQIPTECDKLILIPHHYLHLLPLHALPLAGDSSLFDRFPAGVSYAPSCQLLQLTQTRHRPEFDRLFAVQNPTGDLSYTDLEVETIQSYFNNSNLLKQITATKEAVEDTSLTTIHCAHFSCHGYFNGTEPRKSALILANAELNSPSTQPDSENCLSLENGDVLDLTKCLTLDSIFTLNLEQCRLVTLSACETGLIDFRNTSDEYIGLPSGFLYAGAASVVSSLWMVNDLSTAFLMIRFYQNLQKSLTVALALNQAQLWLRNITKAELKVWITANSLPLDPTMQQNLSRRLHNLQDDQKPCEDPFYWAAFCAIGQ